MSEKMLNVPLDEEVRKKLDERADENGRASSREAAAIITDALRKGKKA
jgi:plasmid stability protein